MKVEELAGLPVAMVHDAGPVARPEAEGKKRRTRRRGLPSAPAPPMHRTLNGSPGGHDAAPPVLLPGVL